MAEARRSVGTAVTRHEDPALLRGSARFAADITLHDALALKVVRSPVAHGFLTELDTEEARALPGVIAVFTAADIAASLGLVPRISIRLSAGGSEEEFLQPVLAHGRVRYVGEPVAIVVADDVYSAEDAADLVFADVDPLPVSVDVRTAEGGEPLFPSGNLVKTVAIDFGDPAHVFATAPVVVEAELKMGRHTAVPLETRGLAVEYEVSDGSIVVHGATKVPHWNRTELSRQLGIEEDRLVMRETSVGGGFGVRGEFYPEDFLVPWAALELKRSVVWVEDRREHLIATNHARDQFHQVALAGTEDGRILGLRSRFWTDMGAYVRTNGLRVPENTVSWLPGPYDIRAYDGVVHCVVTNRTPTGTFRGPGGVESTFVRERIIDIYSQRIGMSSLDVRRCNLIKKHQLPYKRPMPEHLPATTFEEGDYERLFDRVLDEIDSSAVERRIAGGEAVGLGVGLFLERSGAGIWEMGAVEIGSDGGIVVRSGASSVGQGIRTTLAQVVADMLDVDDDQVHVDFLDTRKLSEGVGSFASRSALMAGNAVHLAAGDLIADAKKAAADELEVAPHDLVVARGGLAVKGAPGRHVTFAALAEKRGLSGSATFRSSGFMYDFGVHAAVVRLDRDLGSPVIERLVVGFDVGRAINPAIVEGQLYGAAAQGIGGVLLERLHHDEDGNPMVTSLMDYLLPTAGEIPHVTVIADQSEPAHSNPLGVKGAGEAGITGVAAAVANATAEAAGDAALIVETPIDLSVLVGSSRSKALGR